MKKILFLALLGGVPSSYGQGIHIGRVNPAYENPSLTAAAAYVPPTTITTTNNPVTTAQWHFAGKQTTVNGISHGSRAGMPSSDWIYGMVTTKNNETVACGFGNNGAGDHSGTIFKLDRLGNLVWSNAIDPSIMTITRLDFSSGYLTTGIEYSLSHNGDL